MLDEYLPVDVAVREVNRLAPCVPFLQIVEPLADRRFNPHSLPQLQIILEFWKSSVLAGAERRAVALGKQIVEPQRLLGHVDVHGDLFHIGIAEASAHVFFK